MGANAGVVKAVAYLRRLKKKYPLVSWADTIQMASACAIEHAGGPHRSGKLYRARSLGGLLDASWQTI